MEFAIESLQSDWEDFLRFVPKLVYASLVLLVFLVLSHYAGRATENLMQRSARFRTNQRFITGVVNLVVSTVGLLFALGIMGFHSVVVSLMATGSLIAVVVGFAFREIGENFLAGFFLSFNRPFELGDLIETGGLTGTVRAIELRSVHIRTFDACDVYVPSAQIFSQPLYNYTQDGLRRPSFTVGVAYEDDPSRVIDLLETATSAVADVLTEPAPYVSVKEFSGQFITYEVFFWLDVLKSERGFVAVRNDVKVRCWAALRDAGSTFSSNVTAAVDITAVPGLQVDLADAAR